MVPMVQVTQKPLKLIAVKDLRWTYFKKNNKKPVLSPPPCWNT